MITGDHAAINTGIAPDKPTAETRSDTKYIIKPEKIPATMR